MKKFILLFALAIFGYGLQAQNCQANFTYVVDSSGTTVSFTDQSFVFDSTDYITTWYWDFGDGGTGNQPYETHTYNSQGVYYVCLTVTTNLGASDTYCDSVQVVPNPCAGFSVSGVVTNESTPGANDGAIDVTVSGGTQPFLYNWSTGATTEDMSSLPAGNYCITVTDYNGCAVTNCFNVFTDSSAVLDTLTTTIIDSCLNFTVDTAFIDSYTWIDSTHVEIVWVFQGSGTSSTISVIYEVYQPGNYIALISINCGTKTITIYSAEVYIDQYTGISSVQRENNRLSLYPNPANDVLNVSGVEIGDRISLFNATGQLIRQFTTNSDNTVINVSDLQKGIYIIRIENGNSVITGRFTK